MFPSGEKKRLKINADKSASWGCTENDRAQIKKWYKLATGR
jgi:hypothetical protein